MVFKDQVTKFFFLIYYFIISTDIHEAKLIEDSIQFRKQHWM